MHLQGNNAVARGILFFSAVLNLCSPNSLAQETGKIDVMNALLKTIEATTLAAEVSGKIEVLSVSEGDRVQRGQPLGRIRDRAVKLRYENAKIAAAVAKKQGASRIDLLLAEKRAAVAKNEYERAILANKGFPNTYPPKEIDRLQLVADSAELEIERARLDLDLSKLAVLRSENELLQVSELLEMHRIIAPVSGTIVDMRRRAGEWVEPGTEVLKLVNNERLRIEGFVSGEAASQHLEGRNADVAVTRGKTVIRTTGRVIFVSPDANPVNGNVRLYLEIENIDNALRPGMRVKASIHSKAG